MITTRKSSRTNKYKESFYESDQEDNLKDQDYNPDEFYEKLKMESTFSIEECIPTINFTQYMNALSILSGIPNMILQEKIHHLTLKQQRQLLEYCTRPGSSSIILLERFIKSVVMK